MSEDEEIQKPPASIEIGTLSFTGETPPEKETESTTVVEEQTDTSSVVSEPDDEPVVMQPLSKEANDAYTTYIDIKDAKPSDGAAYAGLTVIIGGFFLGILIFPFILFSQTQHIVEPNAADSVSGVQTTIISVILMKNGNSSKTCKIIKE